jgi:superfamily II DNA or RNA helicase
MAALRVVDKFYVLWQIGIALNSANFPSLNLKPLQVKCLEYLLEGKGVIAVLPTGFGSLLFH